MKGNPERALHLFRSAARLDPKEAWFHHGLARVSRDLGRYDDEERAAREAVRLAPDEPWMHLTLGSVLQSRGLPEEACRQYDRAIELGPNDPWLRLERARFARSQGRIDQASADYRVAAEQAPGEASVLFELGEFSLAINQPEAARDALAEAVRLAPDRPYYRSSLGEAHLRLGQLREAETHLRSAVALDPHDAWLRHRLAQALIGGGSTEEAVSQYRQALAGHPDTPWLNNELGDVLSSSGRIAEAAGCYRQAIVAQMDSGHDTASDEVEGGGEPDFIIVGFPKCGTTALYAYLTETPGIVPATRKEPDYFNLRHHLGASWYRSQFAAVAKPRITGEASARYSVHPEAPHRIRSEVPEARIVVVVRDPVDRAVSDYMMWLRTGGERRSFRQAVTDEMAALAAGSPLTSDGRRPAYVASGLYAAHLDRWMAHRPLESLIIVRADDLTADPAAVVGAVRRFLGLDGDVALSERRENVGTSLFVEEDLRRDIARFYREDQARLRDRYGGRMVDLEGVFSVGG